MRVIVTRPEPEASKWVASLAEAGVDAFALPLIEVGPASDSGPVIAAWEHLGTYDAVMFVSGNAVSHFFALKPAKESVFSAQTAIKTRAFVTGPGTQSALLHVGAQIPWIDAPSHDAGQFDSEALWEVVGRRVGVGYRVLIVRGGGGVGGDAAAGAGRDWFASQVLAAGGLVDFVIAYHRSVPRWDARARQAALKAVGDGSIWVFSSSEAIANLQWALPEQSWSQSRALATHPRIAEAARNAGFAVVCESRPTLAALMASIESMQ